MADVTSRGNNRECDPTHERHWSATTARRRADPGSRCEPVTPRTKRDAGVGNRGFWDTWQGDRMPLTSANGITGSREGGGSRSLARKGLHFHATEGHRRPAQSEQRGSLRARGDERAESGMGRTPFILRFGTGPRIAPRRSRCHPRVGLDGIAAGQPAAPGIEMGRRWWTTQSLAAFPCPTEHPMWPLTWPYRRASLVSASTSSRRARYSSP
jgi:hypothetical protein